MPDVPKKPSVSEAQKYTWIAKCILCHCLWTRTYGLYGASAAKRNDLNLHIIKTSKLDVYSIALLSVFGLQLLFIGVQRAFKFPEVLEVEYKTCA